MNYASMSDDVLNKIDVKNELRYIPINDDVYNANNIINIRNPYPILKQTKSSINTNPLIPNKHEEFSVYVDENNNVQKGLTDMSLKEINKNILDSVMDSIYDLYNKPKNIKWTAYLIKILLKNDRYMYFGFIFIIIALYLIIIKS